MQDEGENMNIISGDKFCVDHLQCGGGGGGGGR